MTDSKKRQQGKSENKATKANKLKLNKETIKDLRARDADKVKGAALRSMGCPL